MMTRLLTTLMASFAGCILLMPITLAQTPDGETPANEGVCDVLQAEGTTKGLYGLCVAFCEAQDHASLDNPITGNDLEASIGMKSAGRILANYNKKRDKANNGTDPAMPCIMVEEPCPCWTEDEFVAASQNAHAAMDNKNLCSDNYFGEGSFHYIWGGSSPITDIVYAYENASGEPFCRISKDVGQPGGISRQSNVTAAELGACRNRIIARQAEFGLVPSNQFRIKPYCLDTDAP